MSLAVPSGPRIESLTREACIAQLGRQQVGRIAFTFHDRVDIQPIHYVHEGDWLYVRTSEGAKLERIAHHPWVAFEVDEVRATFDWTSVVVRGACSRVDPDSHVALERAAAEHAVALLRRIVPETFGPADPVPARTVLLRVHVDEITGRRAVPGP